jgi:hypothetical protein
MTRQTPDVFTSADRPICRGGSIDNQSLIHLAIFGWLQAREAGHAVPAEQETIVRDCLAAITAGQDPREIFGWPAPGAKQADKRRTRNAWREQWMAAEVLRLVIQHRADDETQALEYVADAFDVDLATARRALAEWRDELQGGDLDRHLVGIRRDRALTKIKPRE